MNRFLRSRIPWLVSAFLVLATALALSHFSRDRSFQGAFPEKRPGAATKVDAFREQVAALAQVEEGLLLYREVSPLAPSGLATLTAVACAGGRVAVGGGRHIVVLTPQGDEIRRMTTATDLSCLALDEQGRLYTGLGNAIQAFDASGEPVALFQDLAPDALITSLMATGEEVFAADAQNRRVLRFSQEGVLRQTFSGQSQADASPGFLIPSPYFDLAPGQGRTLWVVNPGRHRLEEYSFDGELIGAWPERAGMRTEDFCGCCNPAHIARLPDGSIATGEKGLARVKLYTRRGGFVGVVAPPDSFDETDGGFDLAADEEGRILVADPVRLQVRVFEKRPGDLR